MCESERHEQVAKKDSRWLICPISVIGLNALLGRLEKECLNGHIGVAFEGLKEFAQNVLDELEHLLQGTKGEGTV